MRGDEDEIRVDEILEVFQKTQESPAGQGPPGGLTIKDSGCELNYYL
jgi:hypothetical protein